MINFRKCLKLWPAHHCCCSVAASPCVPPSLSHLCNSISVLQWALVDLFRRSTKWLAKSHSFFPSLSLLLQPTQACRWHTLPFIIPSLINPSIRLCCHSMFIPSRRHCSQTYSAIKGKADAALERARNTGYRCREISHVSRDRNSKHWLMR